jgi:carboxylesterase
MTAATETNVKTLSTPAKDQTVRFKGGKVGVLLLHGLGGTPAEVRFVAMGLNKAGYTVHTPQLAGHGTNTDRIGTAARGPLSSICARSAIP